MKKTKMIAVDVDVHKAIEALRQGFEETENDILRRHFELPDLPSSISFEDDGPLPHGPAPNGLPPVWERKGVELPEGTELFLAYPGVSASGKIQNGAWVVEGKVFRSPSSAACSIVSKKRGRAISVNGWMYWKVKRPTDSEWVLIHSLRKRVDRRQRHW